MGTQLTPRQQQRKDKWEAAHQLTPEQAFKAAQRKAFWAHASFCQKWMRAWLIVLGLCVVGLLIVPGVTVVGYGLFALGFGAFCVSVIPWILYKGWQIGGQLGLSIRTAATPLPDPRQIAVQLQEEWGRPPTVEEVAAVQQLLTSQRNQALVQSGIGIGALYLFEHNLHG